MRSSRSCSIVNAPGQIQTRIDDALSTGPPTAAGRGDPLSRGLYLGLASRLARMQGRPSLRLHTSRRSGLPLFDRRHHRRLEPAQTLALAEVARRHFEAPDLAAPSL